MKEFYQSIARYYDYIFPLSGTLKEFLLSCRIGKEDDVLDIGCATGEVVLHIAQYARTVTGIDLDADLVDIARRKQGDRRADSVSFTVGDMANLGALFSHGQFRFALCLGNTLVHLLSSGRIDLFLQSVAAILADDGIFVFQVLNYEKILSRRTADLPLIDNEKVTFERRYDHDIHRPLLAFNTRLFIKEPHQIIDNSIDLYPLRREEIVKMKGAALFRSVRFLGGFDGRPFDPEDDLLIGVWQK
jgi:SAM-dependent methyltransferase